LVTIVPNLFLGQERLRSSPPRPKVLAHLAMRREAEHLLSSLSVRLPSPTARVQSLSGGQRQAVAIARALVGEPRLLLLDEPTAALGAAQRREVMDLIRRLRDRGLGIIVITHNLNEVFQVADRISVMRLGSCVANALTAEMTEHQLVAAITGVGETANGPDEGRVSA
jgi:D-xylose transport system ATP-binding protein